MCPVQHDAVVRAVGSLASPWAQVVQTGNGGWQRYRKGGIHHGHTSEHEERRVWLGGSTGLGPWAGLLGYELGCARPMGKVLAGTNAQRVSTARLDGRQTQRAALLEMRGLCLAGLRRLSGGARRRGTGAHLKRPFRCQRVRAAVRLAHREGAATAGSPGRGRDWWGFVSFGPTTVAAGRATSIATSAAT